MLINIDRLPEDGLHLSRNFEFSGVDLVEENAVFLEPVHAEVHVRKVGEEVFLQGRITTRLSFVCSRCLTPFEYPVDCRFDLVYYPEELDSIQDELADEDLDRMFYRDRQVDVRAAVLEQLNLMFPAKPLCDEACEGICAVCGELIRDERCTCAVKDSDPRWQKLKSLVKDKS